MALRLPLFPDLPAPAAGLSARAARAAPLEARNTVQYAQLESRSILNRCQSERVPFDWTLNPYRGCEFACRYCYARYTHGFMELRQPEDFERRIFVKSDGAALLERDLARVRPGEQIALGTATDPYQPAERHYRATRALLEVLARHRGLRLGIITKGTLIARDIDLLRLIADANTLHLRLTITTLDTGLARALEPRAPRPDLRLRTVEKLARAGLSVGVMAAPVLPAITDGEAALRALVAGAAAAGARFFNANALFLKPEAQAVFFPFVRERYPQLWRRYLRTYQQDAYVSGRYSASLAATVAGLCAEFGLQHRREPATAPLPAEQIELFRSAGGVHDAAQVSAELGAPLRPVGGGAAPAEGRELPATIGGERPPRPCSIRAETQTRPAARDS